MQRENIRKEVDRLMAQCFTYEGRIDIITDYIMRLTGSMEAHLIVLDATSREYDRYRRYICTYGGRILDTHAIHAALSETDQSV